MNNNLLPRGFAQTLPEIKTRADDTLAIPNGKNRLERMITRFDVPVLIKWWSKSTSEKGVVRYFGMCDALSMNFVTSFYSYAKNFEEVVNEEKAWIRATIRVKRVNSKSAYIVELKSVGKKGENAKDD